MQPFEVSGPIVSVVAFRISGAQSKRRAFRAEDDNRLAPTSFVQPFRWSALKIPVFAPGGTPKNCRRFSRTGSSERWYAAALVKSGFNSGIAG
jgi:hypothetical protein